MQIEEIEKKLKKYKQELSNIEREIAVNEGKTESVIKELEKYEVSTIEEAEAKLKEWDKEIEKLEKELVKGMEKLEKEYENRI